ncbi:MAG: DUF3419 family protein [Armatimonadota bacterium]
MSRSEVQERADFTAIRYAQVWEDADVLLDGLAIEEGDRCVSIASAGDNALAMLAKGPASVVALDLSASQLACLALRVAAYRRLSHTELLILIGDHDPEGPGHRESLYRRCRGHLSDDEARFWDAHPAESAAGIGNAGKFERYFTLFRRVVLPLIHGRATVNALLEPGRSRDERVRLYETVWNNSRWKWLFRVFFSRAAMGRLGRDPEFFRYVEGGVSERILARTRHALTELDPAENPYLEWILTGRHEHALPYALRAENFAAIRDRIDRITWRAQPVEAFLDEAGPGAIDRYNLSDIFEYMSEESTATLLRRLAVAGRSGGRLAYWNMLAPRQAPESLHDLLEPLTATARELHLRDKAFFYSAFVLERIR